MNLRLAILLLIVAVTGGCQYYMEGRVIEAPESMVVLVSPDDQRLRQGRGIGYTSLDIIVDPRRLNREVVGKDSSQPDGSFKIPINKFGAGFMEYELRIVGRRPGYNSAVGTIDMPRFGQKVLIMLAPGRDTYQAPTDPRKDINRYLPNR